MLNAKFYTDIGQYREKNEDSGGIFYNQTDQTLLVICDGMGGYQAGEVASQFVVEALKERFEVENFIEDHQAEEWLKQNLQSINHELYQLAQTNDAYFGMGTTCVCVLILDHHIVIANIGDSRAYLINERRFEQLTIDHTFVNQLVMLGEITEEKAYHHPRRHIITKVMGTDKRVTPDIFIKRTHFYDYLLLNTDGLTDYVRSEQLHTILTNASSVEEAGEELLKTAQVEGAQDNISFILADIAGGLS